MQSEHRHGRSWWTQIIKKCYQCNSEVFCLYLILDLSTPKHYSDWFFQLISSSVFFLIALRRKEKKMWWEETFSQCEAHEVRNTSTTTTFSSLPGSYFFTCAYLQSWMLLQAMCDASPGCDAPPIDRTATNQKKVLHLVLCYSRAVAHCRPLCKPWKRSWKENKAESWKNLFSLSCVSKDTQFFFEIKKCNCSSL